MYEGLVPISLLLKNIEVIFAPKQWPCFYCRQNRSHRVSPKSCLQTQSSTGTVLITSSGFPTHKEHCLTFAAPPTPSLPSNADLHEMPCFGPGWVQPAAGWGNGSGCASLVSSSSWEQSGCRAALGAGAIQLEVGMEVSKANTPAWSQPQSNA